MRRTLTATRSHRKMRYMTKPNPDANRYRFTRATSMLMLLLGLHGCSPDKQPADTASPSPQPKVRRDPLVGGPFPTLLLAKAQFFYQTDAMGQRKPVPGPAKLSLVRRTDEGWQDLVLEDAGAAVFHKALPFDTDETGHGILTISGTDAALKLWRWRDNRWIVDTLWAPKFGGRFDRLRDVEVGDVTGDGQPDIVVATHDQGVVAVLQRSGDKWIPSEIDRTADTFVHEIELGDVDGDGIPEIFATPSKPNQATLESQPGAIVMYRWDGARFEKRTVAEFVETHAKEILAVDLDGDGRASLLAAVEAHTRLRGRSLEIVRPVEIRRYRFADGDVREDTIVTIEDQQCRCLTPGDVDHDSVIDVVATGMRSGVWLLRRSPDDRWTRILIDAQSSGYEHAALVCDPDGDGQDEVVVASDVQGELRAYTWDGAGFTKRVLAPLSTLEITFNIAFGEY